MAATTGNEGKKPRIRFSFFHIFLISMIFLILVLAAGITYFDYQRTEATYQKSALDMQQQTEDDLAQSVRVVDGTYEILDNNLNLKMREGFALFLQEYEQTGGDPSKLDLQGMKEELGNSMDLYIINDSSPSPRSSCGEGRLFASRGVLWALMLAMPFPYIANHAGWVVAEVGRQPWIVYGLRRTAEATSQNVTAGMTIFTLFGFMGLYALVGLLYLLIVLRIVHAGPGDAGHAHQPSNAPGKGDGPGHDHAAPGKAQS